MCIRDSAQPGRQCAHNLNYWRFGDYLGIGAGAHGKLTLGASQQVLRRWKLRHPELYREKAGTADAVGGDEYLSAQRLPFDFMLNAPVSYTHLDVYKRQLQRLHIVRHRVPCGHGDGHGERRIS